GGYPVTRESGTWNLELVPEPVLVPAGHTKPALPAVLPLHGGGRVPELDLELVPEPVLVPGLVPDSKTAGQRVIFCLYLELPGTKTQISNACERNPSLFVKHQVTALRAYKKIDRARRLLLVPGSSREPSPSAMARLTLTPQPDPCPRCGALTITCLDAPVAALPVRLDPVPLDLAAELAARLAGRATYM